LFLLFFFGLTQSNNCNYHPLSLSKTNAFLFFFFGGIEVEFIVIESGVEEPRACILVGDKNSTTGRSENKELRNVK
jgi:hypothetical protein